MTANIGMRPMQLIQSCRARHSRVKPARQRITPAMLPGFDALTSYMDIHDAPCANNL